MDPKHLPNAVEIGIAPAMMMDPTKPYWGDAVECDPKIEGMGEKGEEANWMQRNVQSKIRG